MIRAAAKNFKDVVVVAAKKDYAELEKILLKKMVKQLWSKEESFCDQSI